MCRSTYPLNKMCYLLVSEAAFFTEACWTVGDCHHPVILRRCPHLVVFCRGFSRRSTSTVRMYFLLFANFLAERQGISPNSFIILPKILALPQELVILYH